MTLHGQKPNSPDAREKREIETARNPPANGNGPLIIFSIAEWLNRNFVQSNPGRCLHCGGPERAHDPLLPFGTEKSGHAWLHLVCWYTWHKARQAQAIAALSTR
jgi:hypothetical protein